MKKLNNRGFSLLELLIAVLILSIITIPLLHTYVTSSRTAARSRQAGDATTAAQNIVETIQANSVSSVLSSDSTAVAGLFGANSAGVAPASSGDMVSLTGIQSGSSLFDAKVTLDPGPYGGSGGINTKEITQYTSMDSTYVQETGNLDPDKIALDDFASKSHYQLPDAEQRTAELTIHSFTPGESGMTGVSVTLQFHYTFLYTEIITVDGVSTPESRTMDIDSASYSLFPAGYTVQTDTPFSVYLLFSPYYDGSMGAYQDEITISNTDNLPCNVFLVKQKTASTTEAAENTYRAQVLLRENHLSDSTNFYASVFSNIGQNLISGSAIPSLQISYRKFYSSVYYVTGNFGNGQLVDRKQEDRLYEITVLLYPHGSSDQLMTFHATKLQ